MTDALQVIRALMRQDIHLCRGSRILVYGHDRDVGVPDAVAVPEGIVEREAVDAMANALVTKLDIEEEILRMEQEYGPPPDPED